MKKRKPGRPPTGKPHFYHWNLKLPPELWKRLKHLVAKGKRSKFVQDAVGDWLDRLEGKT